MNTHPHTRDLQVRLVPIERLIPYCRNARTHTDAQIAQVAASIREFGWTNPILIRPDGVIIAGHARLLAARQLGLSEVPTIELSGLTETQCRALAIADNQLALNAGWDDEMLRIEIAALQEDEFNLGLLGFVVAWNVSRALVSQAREAWSSRGASTWVAEFLKETT